MYLVFSVSDGFVVDLAFTITGQLADTPEPSTAVQVIVVEPSLIAVTLPLSSTVATSGLEDTHLTELFVALLGAIVAVILEEFPSTKLRPSLGFKVIPDTFTTSGSVLPLTFTVHVAERLGFASI